GLFKVVGNQLSSESIGAPRLRRITSITSDAHGTLWICDERDGLVNVKGTRVTSIPDATAGVSAAPLFAYMARSGNLWLAFRGGVIRRLRPDGRLDTFGSDEGLSPASPSTIYEDRY